MTMASIFVLFDFKGNTFNILPFSMNMLYKEISYHHFAKSIFKNHKQSLLVYNLHQL